MSSLVPGFIAEQSMKNCISGKIKAYIMFIDISGFTVITEKLMSHGKEGAEVLSGLINDIFTPSILAVYENGGFVSSFAGDAFTAVFQVDKAEYPLRASFDIYSYFKEEGLVRTKFGIFNVYVKIGLSYGNTDFEIIETDLQNTWYFKGEAIAKCVLSEQKAEEMQIVADTDFIERLNTDIEKIEIEDSYYQILPKKMLLPVMKRDYQIMSESVLRFVPPSLKGFNVRGEFREIISCFINFDEEANYKEGIKDIIRKCHLYGGYFNRVDFGDKGGTILILFGAPIGREKLYQRAVDFILTLNTISEFRYKAGLTSGIAWTGAVGSDIRCEFTALGSSVNLAARLMVKGGWGDILVDNKIIDNLTEVYNTEFINSMQMKGFADKVDVWRLVSKEDRMKDFSYSGNFIGRIMETDILSERLFPIYRKKCGGLVYIDGSPGIGKSRFIDNFIKTTAFDCNYYFLYCDGILRRAFNPFRHFIKYYFEQFNTDDPEEKKRNFFNKFKDLVSEIKDMDIKAELLRTESVIGAMAGIEWENSLFSLLDAESRYENTIYAVKNLFMALCSIKPAVFVFEDSHFIDDDSKEILKALFLNTDNCPFIILGVCRIMDDGSRFEFFQTDDIKVHRIKLEPLERKMISRLIFDRMQISKDRIPDNTLNFIFDKSDGNPLFAEQLLFYMMENDILDKDLNIKLKENLIPSGINQIILARFDRLPNELKDTAKTASVLGREFVLKVLEDLLLLADIPNKVDDIKKLIEIGRKEQIWESISEIRFIFKHSLVKDILYEIQLKKRLRKLHYLAGCVMENLYKGNLGEYYEELAEHFVKAEYISKAVFYLERSGDKARDNYQNLQAILYYDRLLEHLEDNMQTQDIIKTLLKRGEVLELIAKWDMAEESYKRSLKLSDSMDDLKVESMNKLGHLLIEKGEIEEAMAILQRSLDTARNKDYKKGISNALWNIGRIHHIQGDYDRAMDYYKKQISICEGIGDKRGIITAYGEIGGIYLYQGDYDKAMDYYKKQLAMSKEEKDNKETVRAMSNIGIIYSDQGQYDLAMNYYENCLSILKELGYKWGISCVMGNMGIIYFMKREYFRALDYYDSQLRIFEETGNKYGITHANANLGSVFAKLGQFNKAMECYEKNISISRELGDKNGYGIAVFNKGLICESTGNYAEALKNYETAIKISRELKTKIQLLKELCNKAKLLYYLKRTGEAESANDEAMKLAVEVNIPNFIFHCKVLKNILNQNKEALLNMMKEKKTDDHNKAYILYELWRMTGQDKYRQEANKAYKKISKLIPDDYDIKEKLHELKDSS